MNVFIVLLKRIVKSLFIIKENDNKIARRVLLTDTLDLIKLVKESNKNIDDKLFYMIKSVINLSLEYGVEITDIKDTIDKDNYELTLKLIEENNNLVRPITSLEQLIISLNIPKLSHFSARLVKDDTYSSIGSLYDDMREILLHKIKIADKIFVKRCYIYRIAELILKSIEMYDFEMDANDLQFMDLARLIVKNEKLNERRVSTKEVVDDGFDNHTLDILEHKLTYNYK